MIIAVAAAGAAAVLHNAHNNFVHLKRVGQPNTGSQTDRQSLTDTDTVTAKRLSVTRHHK